MDQRLQFVSSYQKEEMSLDDLAELADDHELGGLVDGVNAGENLSTLGWPPC